MDDHTRRQLARLDQAFDQYQRNEIDLAGFQSAAEGIAPAFEGENASELCACTQRLAGALEHIRWMVPSDEQSAHVAEKMQGFVEELGRWRNQR